jgi:hypothetical protein
MFIQQIINQYPPTPDTALGWAATRTISSNAAVPVGCPNSYAIKVPMYDMRFDPMSNFFSTRLGSQGLIIEGYAIAESAASSMMDIFIRFGDTYSNTIPNGYNASGIVRLDKTNYTTWKYFRAYVGGTIPSNGTPKVSINMNSAPSQGWWVSGLTVRQVQ